MDNDSGTKPDKNDEDIEKEAILNDEDIDNFKEKLEEEHLKKLKSSIAQTIHWREKAKMKDETIRDLQQKVESLNAAKPPEKTDKKEEKQDELLAIKDKMERMELRQIASDKGFSLDGEDIDMVFSLSKGFGRNAVEVLNHELFTTYYEKKQEKLRDKGGNISPNNRTKQAGAREYSLDELAQLAKKDYPKYKAIMEAKYKR